MNARVIPAEPVFASNAEREVWERLAAQLDEDDVVLANVRLTNH